MTITMQPPDLPESITGLLSTWNKGDEGALDDLAPLVYHELKKLAGGHLRRERSNHTLRPTALVNEAFLRLTAQRRVAWRNRKHFYAIASHLMRRILVDYARKHNAAKRRPLSTISLDEAEDIALTTDVDLLKLDQALSELARFAPRQSQIVELRFFGGFSIAETAQALDISEATVKTDWQLAKAWLFEQLDESKK